MNCITPLPFVLYNRSRIFRSFSLRCISLRTQPVLALVTLCSWGDSPFTFSGKYRSLLSSSTGFEYWMLAEFSAANPQLGKLHRQLQRLRGSLAVVLATCLTERSGCALMLRIFFLRLFTFTSRDCLITGEQKSVRCAERFGYCVTFDSCL